MENEYYFVNVGDGGKLQCTGKHQTRPKDIDDQFTKLANSAKGNLVLHFHGGLNSEKDGLGTANTLTSDYAKGNADSLFFVWQTSIMDVILAELNKIKNNLFFSELNELLSREMTIFFGGFNGREPFDDVPLEEIQLELAKSRPFENYQTTNNPQILNGFQINFNDGDYREILEEYLKPRFEKIPNYQVLQRALDLHFQNTSPLPTESFGLSSLLTNVMIRAIHRKARKRDHGWRCTIVEELIRELKLDLAGAWIWGKMKEKAANMWLSNDKQIGDDLYAGSYVIAKIKALQNLRPNLRVFLVGHSAGSIAICRLLNMLDKRNININIDTIIFLAPAGLSKLGVNEIVDHPGRFRRFRMFTMDDKFESKDELLSEFYDRSLLYFISGVLEPSEADIPLMGMMRHATQNEPFDSDEALKWAKFISLEGRLALSNSEKLNGDDPEGYRTESEKHGDFDNEPETIKSLIALLET